jgi:hypothetical protein
LGLNGAKTRQEGDRAHCHHRDRCAKVLEYIRRKNCKDESGF